MEPAQGGRGRGKAWRRSPEHLALSSAPRVPIVPLPGLFLTCFKFSVGSYTHHCTHHCLQAGHSTPAQAQGAPVTDLGVNLGVVLLLSLLVTFQFLCEREWDSAEKVS